VEFSHNPVDCAPRAVMWPAAVACWRDLRVRSCAGAHRLSISTLLLEHPVFSAVSGITVPDGRLFK